jgi:hypothetical protein
METSLVIWVLFVHWFADFFCQDDKTALNKSKNLLYLIYHSCLYFWILLVGFWIYRIVFIGYLFTPLFVLNLPAHFVIDAITSRINAKLYLNHRHWFFTMIGLDQFLHYAVLFMTL